MMVALVLVGWVAVSVVLAWWLARETGRHMRDD